MSAEPDARHAQEGYDAIVVGTGVVGCAMARQLALDGARVLVLEKDADILAGASKGNSALLHTGFDAPVGSVEQACIADGYRRYLELHPRFGLPRLACGALVVAWNDDEAARLDDIARQARDNGVDDVRVIDAAEVRQREPALGDGVAGAVLVPGESIIDPWSTPLAYLLQALSHGARLVRRAAVTGGRYDGRQWRLETTAGTFIGDRVVNCAGLHGDEVDRSLLGEPLFEIRPRKGEFVVFDKSAAGLVDAIILPVPGERTKGVVVCRTIFGNLLVGPTAREQESRDDASVDQHELERLMARGRRILPALVEHPVTAVYAGIRPATERKDYRIEVRPASGYASVGGIRSTGLSSALGIARRVCDALLGEAAAPLPEERWQWPTAPALAAEAPRDWQRPGNGGIVCHCELVTRREIEAALHGPLPARSLGALKRRTRATMGRCQGFYCSAALSRITEGHFDETLAEPCPR